MSDAWSKVPNLSGVTAAEGEDTRIADPSRVFTATSVGETDVVAGRLQNMPRARVVYNAGNGAYGGGGSMLPFDTASYDTQNMFEYHGSGSFLVCRTPGIYIVNAQVDANAVAGGQVGTWLRICDPTNTICYAQTTDLPTPASWGSFLSTTGFWQAKIGDKVGVFYTSQLTVALPAGSAFLQVCMISTLGSD